MAEVLKTLKPSAGDYSLMSLWESTEQTDLVAAGDTHVLEYDAFEIDDNVSITGWTTGASNFITLRPAAGHGHGGVSGAGFIIKKTHTTTLLSIAEPYTRVYELEVENTRNFSTDSGVAFTADYGLVDGCIITAGGGSTAIALYFSQATGTNGATISNCLVHCPAGSAGIQMTGYNQGTLSNCTVTGDPVVGILKDAANRTMLVDNCASLTETTTCFNLLGANTSNNASRDGTVTGQGGVPVPNVSLVDGVDLVSPSTGNWRPTATGLLAGAGTSPPTLPTDIAGATRNDPDDIGAYALVDATPPVGVDEMYTNDSGTFVKSTPNIRIGGAWQIPTAYVRSAGAWVMVYDAGAVPAPPNLLFSAPLTHSLILEHGTGDPTYSRASEATFTDWEGVIRTAIDGESRFQGARRVENQLTHTEDLTDPSWAYLNDAVNIDATSWSAPGAGDMLWRNFQSVAGRRYLGWITFTPSASTTVRMGFWDGVGADGADIAVTAGQPVTISFLFDCTSSISNAQFRVLDNRLEVTTTFELHEVQLEDVTGQTYQTASEYVSVGVESAPYHGAGVDGVQYFDTQVGGAPFPARAGAVSADGTPYGYISEKVSTNVLWRSQDFSEATWTKSEVSISTDTTLAPDGSVAERFVESSVSAEHRLYQGGVAHGSVANTASIYAKFDTRRWVYIRLNDGIENRYAWFDVQNGVTGAIRGSGSSSITDEGSGWYRLSFTSPTTPDTNTVLLAGAADNDSLAIYAGDDVSGVYIWGFQCEHSTHASTYIKTEDAAASRVADVLTYPSAGHIEDAAGTLKAQSSVFWRGSVPGSYICHRSDSGRPLYAWLDDTTLFGIDSAGNNPSVTGSPSMTGTVVPAASRWGAKFTLEYNSVLGPERAYSGGMGSGDLGIGCRTGGFDQQWSGTIRNVTIYDSEDA